MGLEPQNQETPSLRSIPTPQKATERPEEEEKQYAPTYKPFPDTPMPTKGKPSKLLEYSQGEQPEPQNQIPSLRSIPTPQKVPEKPEEEEKQYAPTYKPYVETPMPI